MNQAGPSVFDVFAGAVRRWPMRSFLNVLPGTARAYGISAGEISYAAAAGIVEDWGSRFRAAGYGPGMRIALLLENRPDYFLIWLAANRLGMSVVPINPDLRAAELEYLIGHAEPALIIATRARQGELRRAARAARMRAPVIMVGNTLPEPRGTAKVARSSGRSDEREAAVLYTSGTTGQPKGCVLANRYFTEMAEWYAGLGGIISLTEQGERMITPLPIFHMNAMACSFMVMMQVGGCLTVLDRFHPSTWWQDVRDSGATCLHYLGVMPSILMGMDAGDAERAHDVRFGFGAGVDPKLHGPFEQRFGFPLMEAWAMTETGAGAVISNHHHDRLIGQSSLGPVPEWLEVRLVDEAGLDVPTGDPGELLVRRRGERSRDGFFSEYYKNEAATEEAWAGGWFHTGDVVRQGEGGNMFFVDRRKNVIRRSGENIAAVEVESVLMRHPEITAAGVAPVADAIRGDEVFACLCVSDRSYDKAREIGRWALDQMAYYKVPGYIAFVDALPLTPTQKIQRAELKVMVAELVNAPETVNLTDMKKRQVA
ncbi:AMP-binding protein [Alisedimentitalea sp. MJ-SS2]|uniref:AMP-binding protein n=1 Tax=Aliisedimentitalea sp. MJ-SS2 TaxID=3049795 RepID=UPI00290614D9|nr:AMP-binding protein [Alisedimentitalea sp. MJ-SS2]MDU8926733.1 AMP-binding protein [Alisedimentitalea sp. MJ-SS2]